RCRRRELGPVGAGAHDPAVLRDGHLFDLLLGDLLPELGVGDLVGAAARKERGGQEDHKDQAQDGPQHPTGQAEAGWKRAPTLVVVALGVADVAGSTAHRFTLFRKSASGRLWANRITPSVFPICAALR